MPRWIHEFRSSGERALTEDERTRLARRARGLMVRRVVFAILAVVLLPLGIVVGIAIAADPNPFGWVIMMGSFVPFGYFMAWSNNAGNLALLYRRALRLGLVEEFRRVRGDETARRLWAASLREVDEEDDDDPADRTTPPATGYWSVDERFEEDLRRTARREVRTFEAVGRDGALLWVEGRPVRKVLEPPVWEVPG